MFEYTHIVKDNKGGEWGAFQNEGMAKIMQEALATKFSHNYKTGIQFFTEPIK